MSNQQHQVASLGSTGARDGNVRGGRPVRVHAPTRGREAPPQPRTRVHAAKIDGGHIAIRPVELACLWGMLLDGRIGPSELRTYLACREARERRKFAKRAKQARYGSAELARLVGGGGETRVQASLRKLERLGLVRWTSFGPAFIESPENLAVDDLSTVFRIQRQMPPKRRSFPLPRRVLRLIAGGVKRSVAAAFFGHLIRCPHYSRANGWSAEGTCKSSWVAETFGVSLRAAKEARAHLIHELGWLIPEESPQWHQNRFGGRFAVNLAWGDAGEERRPVAEPDADPVSAPPHPQNCTRSAPPESDQNSLQGEMNSSALRGKAPGPRDDSFNSEGGGGDPPELSKVSREDLRSIPRVMELFDQAAQSRYWKRRGWAPSDSYHERLNWAAAARRARVRGGGNPCGLFVHLVAHRKWAHISNDDEEAVRGELSAWLNPEPCRASQSRRAEPVELSEDGKKLRYVEGVIRRNGLTWTTDQVDRELVRQSGWSEARVRGARENLCAWIGKPVSSLKTKRHL